MTGYTLHVKTCNTTFAGTANKVQLSFCSEKSSCEDEPKNNYNEYGQLSKSGIWNSLHVPLDYEPDTMTVYMDSTDSW